MHPLSPHHFTTRILIWGVINKEGGGGREYLFIQAVLCGGPLSTDDHICFENQWFCKKRFNKNCSKFYITIKEGGGSSSKPSHVICDKHYIVSLHYILHNQNKEWESCHPSRPILPGVAFYWWLIKWFRVRKSDIVQDSCSNMFVGVNKVVRGKGFVSFYSNHNVGTWILQC